jgi:hypothetical protein
MSAEVGKRRSGKRERAHLLVSVQNRSMVDHLEMFECLLLHKEEYLFKIFVVDFLKLMFAGLQGWNCAQLGRI